MAFSFQLTPITVLENQICKLSPTWLKVNEASSVDFSAIVANGRFLVNGTATRVFTWSDVKAGKVSFEQLGSASPSFTITGTTGGESFSASSSAEILVFKAVNDKAVFAVRPHVLQEGGVLFLRDMIDVRDEEDDATGTMEDSVYTAKCSGGWMVKNGVAITTFTHGEMVSGAIHFQHDGGKKIPVISLVLRDTGGQSSSFVFNPGFNNINDPISIKSSRVIVEAGKAIKLNTQTFGLSDQENGLAAAILYLEPEDAYLIKVAGEVRNDGRFTYQELKSGKVSLTLIDGTLVPNLALRVIEQYGSTSRGHLLVQLKDTSAVSTTRPGIKVGDSPLALSWQDETKLDETFFSLGGSAVGATPAGLLFKASAVKGGFFRVNSQDKAILFTLQDLRDGLVSFVHDGIHLSPSFTLGLVDATGKAASLPLVSNNIGFAADLVIAEDQLATMNLADNRAGLALEYSVKSQGSKGLAEIHGQTLTYTPQVDAFGEDTLVLEVRDAKGGMVLRPFHVAISSSDERPVVLVSGAAKIGAVLSAAANFADDEGVGTITYLWQDASGMTLGEGSSYTIKQTDFGKPVKAVAAYTNSESQSVSVYSAPVTATSLTKDIRVSTSYFFDTTIPKLTALADGGWVAVWQSNQQDGSGWGIYQQRYNSQGERMGLGGRVNSTVFNDQKNPDVAALADSGWVVTWQSGEWDSDIYLQRFAADGTKLAGELLVNSHINSPQSAPSITSLADGGWVVTWQSGAYSGIGIYQQRYAASGAIVAEAARVANSDVNQFNSSVTNLLDGGWLVIWQSGERIYQQRYNAEGTKINADFFLSTAIAGASVQVTGLVDGGWLVTWWSTGSNSDIYQQRYAANGDAMGEPRLVNTTTADHQILPEVAALADGGWLVVWQSYDQNNWNDGIYLQRYDRDGDKIGTESRVNHQGDANSPTLAVLTGGDWVLAWQDSWKKGIFQQRLSATGSPEGGWSQNHPADWAKLTLNDSTPNDVPNVGDQLKTVLATHDSLDPDGQGEFHYQWQRDGENIEDATNSTYTLTEFDAGHFIAVAISYVDGHGYTEQTRIPVPLRINHRHSGGVSLDGDAIQGHVLTASNTLEDEDGLGPISYTWKADGAQFASGSSATLSNAQFGKTVTVTASYTDGQGHAETAVSQASARVQGLTIGESRANGSTPGAQFDPTVITLADGGWLTVWQSSGSVLGENANIYQQRFDANGVNIGWESRVNTISVRNYSKLAASSLAEGGWLITWVSSGQEESGRGVYQQRYNAEGERVGEEGRVNTDTLSYWADAAVTSLYDGGWLVVWSSEQAGMEGEIYQQRFGGDGVRIGGGNRVNASSSGDQSNVAVTPLADGGWLVCWHSEDYQQNRWWDDICLQRYDASGFTVGNETRVNAGSFDDLASPVMTGLEDGGWVVSWQSRSQNGLSWDVRQQRYAADGSPVGNNERVNVTTAGAQEAVSLTALADGGWLVSWQSENQNGMNDGVYLQRYDARGNSIGTETSVVARADDQRSPSLTTLGDGGWMIAWQSRDEVTWDAGIYQQRFLADGNPIGGWSGGNRSPQNWRLSIGRDGSADAQPGNQLSAVLSSDLEPDGLGRDLSYQWLRDGEAIEGAVSATYVLTHRDVAHKITYSLHYTDGHGRAETLTAPSSISVSPSGLISITGQVVEGLTLKASIPIDANRSEPVTYVWHADDVFVGHGQSLILSQSEVGKDITVTAYYYDRDNFYRSTISAPTATVQNVNDKPGGTVEILPDGYSAKSFKPYPGQYLYAHSYLWDEDGLGEITYHWLAGNQEFATGESVTLSDAQLGKSIKLVATYTDLHGTVERVESAASAAVNPKNKPIPFSFSFMPIKVTEGQALQLDAKWLKLAGPSEGVYFYASTESGRFLNGTETTGFFSVADLTAGKISFESYLGSWEEPRFSITGYNSHGDSFHAESDAKTLAFTPYLTLSQISVIENKPLKLSTSWLKLAGSSEGVIFHVNAENGQFIKEGETTDSFDWDELNAGKISFEQLGGNLDLPRFSIMAYLPNGESFRAQSNTETLVFKAVNDKPELSTWFVVDEGGSLNLRDVLWLRDEEDEAAGLLEQAIYTAKASHGQFFKNGVAVKSFSHGDVLNGSVVFVHDGGDKAPVIRLEVKDSGKAITRLILNAIPFNPVNDPITIKPTLLTLEAGKTIKLSSETFGLIDPDGDLARAVITLEHGGEGLIQVAGRERPDGHFSGAELLRGQVSLTLFSLEKTLSLGLHVVDEGGSETHSHLQVQLKASKLPIIAAGIPIELIRHGETVLEESFFRVGGSAFGAPPATLVFRPSAIKGGSFLVAGHDTAESFTLADLREGRVSFLHDGDSSAPSFALGFVDAAGKTAKPLVFNSLSFATDVAAIEDMPTILALAAVDAGGHALSYTIKSPGAKGTTVIQGNILTYIPHPNDAGVDRLVVEIHDANGGLSQRTFHIVLSSSTETPAVTVSGTAKVGGTLFASANVADDLGFGLISYVWQDGSGTVLGAGPYYFLRSADLGLQIQAVATYSDTSGDLQHVSSALSVPVSALAPAIPITSTAGDHSHPDMALLASGGWVAAWQFRSEEGNSIHLKRFDKNGLALGDEIFAGAALPDDSGAPGIAALTDGGFLLHSKAPDQHFVLQRYDKNGVSIKEIRTEFSGATALAYGGWILDKSESGHVYLQRFNAQGVALGEEFQVDAGPLYLQGDSHVTPLTDGGWLVSRTISDQDGYAISLHRYAANGTALEAENLIRINARPNSHSVTALKDGAWVVAWDVAWEGSLDSPWHVSSAGQQKQDIFQQQFTADGASAGDIMRVNRSAYFENSAPQLTALADGGWVTTWKSLTWVEGLADAGIVEVYQQRYDAKGVAHGPESRVELVGYYTCDVMALPDGGWMVVSQGWNGREMDIFQKRFSADGQHLGDWGIDHLMRIQISGDARPGNVLHADASDEDGLGPIHWQWMRDGQTIDGAQEASYTVLAIDVGSHLSVQGVMVDGHGNVEYSQSESTNFVRPPNHQASGSVFIIGTAAEHQLLTAGIDITDPDGLGLGYFNYTWIADETIFSRESSVILGQGQVGKHISVIVDYFDGQGNRESKFSDATAAVENLDNAPEGRLMIALPGGMSQNFVQSTAQAITYWWSPLSSLVIDTEMQIFDVDVQLDISHTRDSDLSATLIAPDGTRIPLFAHVGEGGDNFTGTRFDSQAQLSIGQGTAPFTGNFRPLGNLSSLAGKNAHGTWHLELQDSVTSDAGTLQSWGLQITSFDNAAGHLNAGQVLHAVNSVSDEDGLGPISYSWRANGIEFSSSASVQLSATQVGSELSLVASYIDGFGHAESVSTSGGIVMPIAEIVVS